MAEEIPDGMDEIPLHPQTVEGKIREMRDIGLALIDSTDEIMKAVETLGQEHMIQVGMTSRNAAIRLLTGHILKLSTLTQLQTDTITQLYGELRGPGW